MRGQRCVGVEEPEIRFGGFLGADVEVFGAGVGIGDDDFGFGGTKDADECVVGGFARCYGNDNADVVEHGGILFCL